MKIVGWKIRQNLLGKKFTRLIVISRLGVGSHGHMQWLCRCDCSNYRVVTGDKLTGNQTKSCGCYNVDQNKIKQTTHGKYGTRAYRAWFSMLQRCRNPNNKQFSGYGGRGIIVCREWERFENFYKDMGDPEESQSLDRININGNYNRKNCRWASVITQANNKRNNRKIKFNRQTKTVANWARETGIKSSIIRRRIDGLGWSVRKSLTTEVRS